MAQFSYRADTTNLPSDFDEAKFVDTVDKAITGVGIPAGTQPILRSGIIGMLLLDGSSDPDNPSLGSQIRNRLWIYVQSPLVDTNGVQLLRLTNRDAFIAVNTVIRSERGPSGAYYQELAAAARQIIDGQRGGIVHDKILLTSAVQSALQDYGTGSTSQGSFELPPLSGPTTGGGIDEINPVHIRAVAMHLAAYELEVAGLWQALQRSLEIFMNGQLPVSTERAGNMLNAYYWDQINQMSESARWMQYTRVLGVDGGEVSKEVQRNVTFMPAFTTLVSSLSEYDRQQRVADMLGNSRGLSLTGEHVRKAARDLAANCTLYGYGYTQFAAKKLQTQIQTALNIFKLSDFQAAWGVQSAWQAVQRIMSQEFQKTPNIVKQTTLAQSGKKVLDLVAKNPDVWSATSDKPLFSPDGAMDSDIKEGDRKEFMRHAEYILAVQGSSDAEVTAAAAPKPTDAIASIPSLNGGGAAGNGHNADIAGQIQQMLSQNQTPSPDQLRKMIGV